MVSVGPRIGLAGDIPAGMINSADGHPARYAGAGKALEAIVAESFGFAFPCVITAGQGAFLVVPGQLVILYVVSRVSSRKTVGVGNVRGDAAIVTFVFCYRPFRSIAGCAGIARLKFKEGTSHFYHR